MLLGKGVVIQGMNQKMIQSEKIHREVDFCLKLFLKPSMAYYFLADRDIMIPDLFPGSNPNRL